MYILLGGPPFLSDLGLTKRGALKCISLLLPISDFTCGVTRPKPLSQRRIKQNLVKKFKKKKTKMQKKKNLQSYSEHSSNFFLCMYFSCTIDRGLYEVARPKIKRFSFFLLVFFFLSMKLLFIFFSLFLACLMYV